VLLCDVTEQIGYLVVAVGFAVLVFGAVQLRMDSAAADDTPTKVLMTFVMGHFLWHILYCLGTFFGNTFPPYTYVDSPPASPIARIERRAH
jgi:hypothetical protein